MVNEFPSVYKIHVKTLVTVRPLEACFHALRLRKAFPRFILACRKPTVAVGIASRYVELSVKSITMAGTKVGGF